MRNISWTIKHLNNHIWRLARRLPAYAFRYGISHACAYLISRTWFFLTRKVIPVWFPGGYTIATPQQLINHQSIFVERELWHNKLRTKNIKTYLDIGANMGQTVLFYKQEFFGLTVTAIEPLAYLFKDIEENLRTAGLLAYYPCAIAPTETVQLYVNRDVGGLSASTTNQAAKECAEVPAIKSIPSVFDLIKIDVDGAETIILNNLTNDQWLYAKAFVIECKADQIKEITSIVKGHRPDLVRHKTGNVDYIWL